MDIFFYTLKVTKNNEYIENKIAKIYNENKESENMEIPVVFIDNLKSERWKDLYEFWRSL